MIRFPRRALHGDFFRTKSDVYFTVIGDIHPPNRIVSYPRYIPHSHGDRRLGSRTYLRLKTLDDCNKFLRQHMKQSLIRDPVFDETLCEIPVVQVADYLYPELKLEQLSKVDHLDSVQKTARDFCQIITKLSKIPPAHIGISGSILCGLHKEASDIDVIIYGETSSRRVHSTLLRLIASKAHDFRQYKMEELRRLYEFRSRDTIYSNFGRFASTEHGKSCQGFYRQQEFFVRFVRSNHYERYGWRRYGNLGKIDLSATVTNDNDSIFTPCAYMVTRCKSEKGLGRFVKEVTSFRGRFCEQAKVGDRIRVRGKLESVVSVGKHYLRVLIGNELEDCIVRLK